MRPGPICHITRGRIIGVHSSTNKTVFSRSIGDSTEWKRIRQDSRSKSGLRMLTHDGHVCLYSSTQLNYVTLFSNSRKTAVRWLWTREEGLRSLEDMDPKRFVLSLDDEIEFRSRCE